MKILTFDAAASDAWDRFIEKSINATFLHSRRFLSYHKDRFTDQSLLIENERGNITAVFPAAVVPGDPGCVASHPGATFGGIVTDGSLSGGQCIEVMRLIARHYRDLGFERLIYKVVPYIYHQRPCQDDLYALFRLDARRVRCDLTAAIDLSNRGRVSERRKRGVKKSEKSGIQVAYGKEYLAEFWAVLERNLADKHGAKPVHTLDEMKMLLDRFDNDMQIAVALLDSDIVAGTVLFNSSMVSHAQYIASTEAGHRVSALDAVFESVVQRAINNKKRYFDFGISNERAGRYLNDNLYQFKSQFGSGGVTHEFFELGLGGMDVD